MAMIGNPIVSTDFPVDYFSGNGSTTAFTMSVAPASVNSIDVQVSGVSQSPQTYSVSGTTLTFSAAPPTGSSNIVVRHLGVAGIPNTPSAGSVVNNSIADATITAAKFAAGQTPAFNGIAFPATQVPSADANTLDDYEEGTWTPALTGWTSLTYQARLGYYVKIGKQVTCWFDVQPNSGTNGSSAVTITGLPFTIGANSVGGGMTTYSNLPVNNTSYYPAYPYSSAISFYTFTNGAAVTSNANISTALYLQGCVIYNI